MESITDYVSTKRASEQIGLTQRPISHLIRKEIVKGHKVGHGWLVYLTSLKEYVSVEKRVDIVCRLDVRRGDEDMPKRKSCRGRRGSWCTTLTRNSLSYVENYNNCLKHSHFRDDRMRNAHRAENTQTPHRSVPSDSSQSRRPHPCRVAVCALHPQTSDST